ncbi:MAG: hypothetical protein OEZ04_01915, partial [Nitrospinota bacterium]|nr:hypothetical protein [Nitrospinota bacterium]
MMDRLKITIAVLALGMAALGWALINLQLIFMTEREEALAALASTAGQTQRFDTSELTEHAARIDKRFRLKSSFVLSSGMLGVIIAALAILAQWRKARMTELKSDFVATVSHELKTPLASIRLLAETMEHGEESGSPTPGYPRRIVEAVDGLGFLVENILSFNRLGKDGWRLRKSFVSLGQAVAWAREEARG